MRNTRLQSTSGSNGTELILEFLQCIPRLVLNFPEIAALRNAELEKGGPQQFENMSSEVEDAQATFQPNPIATPVLSLPCRLGKLSFETEEGKNQNLLFARAGSAIWSKDTAGKLVLNT